MTKPTRQTLDRLRAECESIRDRGQQPGLFGCLCFVCDYEALHALPIEVEIDPLGGRHVDTPLELELACPECGHDSLHPLAQL